MDVIKKWVFLGVDIVRFGSQHVSDFVLTMVVPEDPSKWKGLIVNPVGGDNVFPTWAIFFTTWPAIGVPMLGSLDQNLTSWFSNGQRLVRSSPLPALRVCLHVVFFIFHIGCTFGLPFTHDAAFSNLAPVKSLSFYHQKGLAEGTKVQPVFVVERRVTDLGVYTLIALSSLAP